MVSIWCMMVYGFKRRFNQEPHLLITPSFSVELKASIRTFCANPAPPLASFPWAKCCVEISLGNFFGSAIVSVASSPPHSVAAPNLNLTSIERSCCTCLIILHRLWYFFPDHAMLNAGALYTRLDLKQLGVTYTAAMLFTKWNNVQPLRIKQWVEESCSKLDNSCLKLVLNRLRWTKNKKWHTWASCSQSSLGIANSWRGCIKRPSVNPRFQPPSCFRGIT